MSEVPMYIRFGFEGLNQIGRRVDCARMSVRELASCRGHTARSQSLVAFQEVGGYKGSSLRRNRANLGPYSRTMPRALWWS